MRLCQYYWTDAHIRDIGLDNADTGCALNTWYNCVKLGDGEGGEGNFIFFSQMRRAISAIKAILDDQFSPAWNSAPALGESLHRRLSGPKRAS